MKKEPMDYLIDIMAWLVMTPMMLTENSKQKWLRITGRLLCLPFAITWVVTAIPLLLCFIVLVIAQLCYE